MQFEREQFDDSLLDDNFVQETEDVDLGFQSMADLEKDVVKTEDDVTEDTPTTDTHAAENAQDTDASTEELDIMSQFLQSRGIRDGKTIVYEDEETGETSEVDFSTLSKPEQLQILSEISSPDLSEDEIQTINYLRENNVTLQDVITYYQDQAVKAYIENNKVESTSSVDSYDDDVIYLAEMKRRFPSMSEDELESELEAAKSNEELFKKKVEVIRDTYKQEEEKQAQEAIEAQQRQQEEYQKEFVNQLNNFSYVLMDHTDPKSDKLVIEDADRQAIYDYIFKKGPNGTSQLVDDLNNTEVLIQLA